jgi:hypothetical protein
LRRADAWITGANDEIDFGPYDSRRVVRKLIDAKPKAAIVDDEVFAIDETIRFDRIEQGDIIKRIAWTKMQVAEAISPPWLLSTRGKRPCSRGASDQRHEVATSHWFSPTGRGPHTTTLLSARRQASREYVAYGSIATHFRFARGVRYSLDSDQIAVLR